MVVNTKIKKTKGFTYNRGVLIMECLLQLNIPVLTSECVHT